MYVWSIFSLILYVNLTGKVNYTNKKPQGHTYNFGWSIQQGDLIPGVTLLFGGERGDQMGVGIDGDIIWTVLLNTHPLIDLYLFLSSNLTVPYSYLYYWHQ